MPTTSSLAMLTIFIVPGFIFRLVVGRNALSAPETDLRFLVRSLVDSLMIHALFIPWSLDIYGIWAQNQLLSRPLEVVQWAVSVLLIAPFVFGFIWSKIQEWRRAQPVLSLLGMSWGDRLIFSWDWMAAKREGYWVVLEFKDGKKVGGRYEFDSRMSLTTWLAHAPRDVFIEQLYQLTDDDKFGEPLPYTKGAWINGEELRMVRLYREEQLPQTDATKGKNRGWLKEVLTKTWVSRQSAQQPAPAPSPEAESPEAAKRRPNNEGSTGFVR